MGVIVSFLESYGLGIRIARSGESALRRIQYDQPDIVLLDVLMPSMDGFETCRQLKTNPKTRDIPVIFMTSLTSVEDKIKGFEAGAVDYVTKPLHQEEVLARVTTHLQLRELTRTLQSRHEHLQVTSEQEKARLFDAVKQQREQLRILNTRLNEVKEAEHKQLARELHDELGQTLTAIQINLAVIKTEVNGNLSASGHERLAETEQLTTQTLERVRQMSLDLRPPMLDHLGLEPTLYWYVKQYRKRVGIAVDFQTVGIIPRFDTAIETNLYRIVQEALTNVAKHAQATAVRVSLEQRLNQIRLTIKDDGQGFDWAAVANRVSATTGAGLVGIQERTLLLNGQVDIDTAPDKGCCIAVTIPFTP
ncbi:MAG: response regulator [Chloroflexota bacterium]